MTRPGFVYVFLRADGLRKLGWTINVRRRRRLLAAQFGVPHQIERIWGGMGDWAAYRVECRAHLDLKPFRANVWSFEVYGLPLKRIADAVERSMKIEAECHPPYGLAVTTWHLQMFNEGLL